MPVVNQSNYPNKHGFPYRPVAIYNHLDIKIKINPSIKSKVVFKKMPKSLEI